MSSKLFICPQILAPKKTNFGSITGKALRIQEWSGVMNTAAYNEIYVLWCHLEDSGSSALYLCSAAFRIMLFKKNHAPHSWSMRSEVLSELC